MHKSCKIDLNLSELRESTTKFSSNLHINNKNTSSNNIYHKFKQSYIFYGISI